MHVRIRRGEKVATSVPPSSTWGDSASRESEGGGREGGSRGKWIDGRTKRVHVYMHVLGEEKKSGYQCSSFWYLHLHIHVDTCTCTWCISSSCSPTLPFTISFYLVPFPPPPFRYFFPPSSIPSSAKCVHKKS